MKLKNYTLCILLLLAVGCGQRKARTFEPLPFPSVTIPSMYAADAESANAYLATHFWNKFTDTSKLSVSDSLILNGVKREEITSAFMSWLGVLQNVDLDVSKKSMSHLAARLLQCESKDTSSVLLEDMTELVEKYLYDPNSPVRMEDLYGAYALKLSGFEGFEEAKRDYYAHQAQMCALNAVGTPAADFMFCDAKGMMTNLYDIKAEYIIMFFSNPGCEACKEIITTLSHGYVNELIAAGKLAVVNVYIDEDIEAWYGYMPIYPDNWHNGYEPQGIIRSDLLYNVRAIPSLYVLDKDKNVILKDAPEQAVYSFIDSL